MYQFGALEGAMREKDMLWEITDYLKAHPKAAVVNLGCGLNMTGRTADNGTCRIYNLDFPDVIKSRNELVPAGEREENIACDLNDFFWMNQIDAGEGAVTSFMFKVERKHKEECNANREKSWQETLKFLREEWQV